MQRRIFVAILCQQGTGLQSRYRNGTQKGLDLSQSATFSSADTALSATTATPCIGAAPLCGACPSACPSGPSGAAPPAPPAPPLRPLRRRPSGPSGAALRRSPSAHSGATLRPSPGAAHGRRGTHPVVSHATPSTGGRARLCPRASRHDAVPEAGTRGQEMQCFIGGLPVRGRQHRAAGHGWPAEHQRWPRPP